MTDDDLRDLVKRARKVAQKVGPMHAYWDMIFDAEAYLDGGEAVVPRETIEKMLLEAVGNR